MVSSSPSPLPLLPSPSPLDGGTYLIELLRMSFHKGSNHCQLARLDGLVVFLVQVHARCGKGDPKKWESGSLKAALQPLGKERTVGCVRSTADSLTSKTGNEKAIDIRHQKRPEQWLSRTREARRKRILDYSPESFHKMSFRCRASQEWN
jgi:hypothetical protein